MPQPRRHENNAARCKAYQDRKKQSANWGLVFAKEVCRKLDEGRAAKWSKGLDFDLEPEKSAKELIRRLDEADKAFVVMQRRK